MIQKTAIVYRYGRLAVLVFTMGLVFAMQPMRALAVTGLALVWTPSTSSNVAGYHVYYGGMSGVYTNRVSTDNATNAVISGLVEGATYYFAAAAYDSAGLESPLSNEAFSVATPAQLTLSIPAGGQLTLRMTGASGIPHVIEASTDLVHWVSVETNVAPFTFTDPAAGQFSQRFYRSVAAL